MERTRETQQVTMKPNHIETMLLTKNGIINAGIEIKMIGNMTLMINSLDGNLKFILIKESLKTTIATITIILVIHT